MQADTHTFRISAGERNLIYAYVVLLIVMPFRVGSGRAPRSSLVDPTFWYITIITKVFPLLQLFGG